MNAKEKLIERMLNFDGNFEGYPTMTNYDVELIQSAVEEDGHSESIVLLTYLASEHVKTRAQYYNAKRFIEAYVANCFECNMCEGHNPVHAEIEEEIDVGDES